jgi:hypothetical protein
MAAAVSPSTNNGRCSQPCSCCFCRRTRLQCKILTSTDVRASLWVTNMRLPCHRGKSCRDFSHVPGLHRIVKQQTDVMCNLWVTHLLQWRLQPSLLAHAPQVARLQSTQAIQAGATFCSKTRNSSRQRHRRLAMRQVAPNCAAILQLL